MAEQRAAARRCLGRSLHIDPEDEPGLPLSAGAGASLMAAYYLMTPISDAAALRVGVSMLPSITLATLFAVMLCAPAYSLLVHALPQHHILPAVYRFFHVGGLTFALAFAVCGTLGSCDDAALSFALPVWVGTFSLYSTATFWAVQAYLHTRREAARVFGIITGGQQAGQLLASLAAAPLYQAIGYWTLLISIVLLEAAVQCIAARQCQQLPREYERSTSPADAKTTAGPAAASRKGWQAQLRAALLGGQLLLSTPLLRGLTLHTFLVTFLTSAVYYERGAIVAASIATDEQRVRFFAVLNALVAACTLAAQLLLAGRCLGRLGTAALLLFEPVVLLLGLLAFALSPGLIEIALLDGVRKFVHYALGKPAKEAIYASLAPEIKYTVKAMVDTVVYRSGSATAAGVFALSLAFGVPVPLRVGVLLAVAFAWALNAFAIGREAERHDTPAEAAPILQTSERIGGGRAGGDDGPGGAGDTGGTALVLRAFACAALGLLAVGFSVVSVAVCARRGICQAGGST